MNRMISSSCLGPSKIWALQPWGRKKIQAKSKQNSRTDEPTLNFPARLMEGNPARTKWDTVGNPSAKNGRCLHVGNIPIIAQGIEWLARKTQFPQCNWAVSSTVDWVWPPPSNSDQQDYYIFRRYLLTFSFHWNLRGHTQSNPKQPGTPLVTCEHGQVKFWGPNSGTAISILLP